MTAAVDSPKPPLAYATPDARQGSPTVAATILAFVGLALIVLGGCFMIPVSMPLLLPREFTRITPGMFLVGALLTLIAFTCFFFAGWLILLAARRLLLVMRG